MSRRSRRPRGTERRRDAVVTRQQVFDLPDGRQVELGSLLLQDFLQLKRRALEVYKRQMLKTWSDNADLLPAESRTEMLREAFERAEQLTYEDLPRRRIRSGAEVDWPTWWAAEEQEGMLHSVWLSMRRCPGQEGVTLDDADQLFRKVLEQVGEAAGQRVLDEAADVVGDLSSSHLLSGGGEGDGRDSPTGPPTTAE